MSARINFKTYYVNAETWKSQILTGIQRAGWTYYDYFVSGDTYHIFRSQGEGDKYAPVYLRVRDNPYSAYFYFCFSLYLYWDRTIHSGSIHTSEKKIYSKSIIDCYLHFVGNKQIIAFAPKGNSVLGWGFMKNYYYPYPTTITSNISAGDMVTVPVVSSEGFLRGSKLQIIGSNGEGRDTVEINSVPNSNSVVITNIPRDYAYGSYIGYGPCPAIIFGVSLPVASYALNDRREVGTSMNYTQDSFNIGQPSYPILDSYRNPDYSNKLYGLTRTKALKTENDSLIGYLDGEDFIMFGFSSKTWFKTYDNSNFCPRPYRIKYGTLNTVTIRDDEPAFAINEHLGRYILIFDGNILKYDEYNYVGIVRKIASNTSNVITVETDFYPDIPNSTCSFRIVDEVWVHKTDFFNLLEEDHSISASSSSSSSHSSSSSSGSSSSSSVSSSSTSSSSSSSSYSSSSSSNSSSSSYSYSSSSSFSYSISSSSSSSSLSSSSTSSSSSSRSYSSGASTYYPNTSSDDGFDQEYLITNWSNLSVNSSTGTFTQPTTYSWSAITASWELRFTAENRYQVWKDSVLQSSDHLTTDSQTIIGTYDFPKFVVFASNFGGTFYEGDSITFDTTATTYEPLDVTSTYLKFDGSETDAVDTWNNEIFIMFKNVTLNKEARIKSAFVRLTASTSSDEDTSQCEIRLLKNETAPSEDYDIRYFRNRKKYTEIVSWTMPAFTVDNAYDTPDLTDMIQEAVDSSTWQYGDNIIVCFYSGGTIEKRFYSYDNGSNYPELHIEYES